jgi:NAD dependent epimerase/dehydratase family enzyme
VCRLVRRPPSAPDEAEWSPEHGLADAAARALEGTDVVVHLAGESLAEGAGAPRASAACATAGSAATERLARSLAVLERPPSVLLVASAIGIYGSRGDERLDEDERAGRGLSRRARA